MASRSMLYKKGDVLWFSPDPKNLYQIPWAGKLLEKQTNHLRLLLDDGQEVIVNKSRVLQVIDSTESLIVEDMVALTNLQEHSILRNIHLRYIQNSIYTYIGRILVSVNPYRNLPIFGDKEIQAYHDRRIGDLPPHLYAVGAQCLFNLKMNHQSQCIIISGETGAGKTENTKLLLNFLASHRSKDSTISNKIIQANPILEAFGNACTTENNNSSRFGKYIEVYFREDATIAGARIQHFLLERSRVKGQNEGDRNYHIFYYLFAGLNITERKELSLKSLENYMYMTQHGVPIQSKERTCAEDFKSLKKSLSELSFESSEIKDLIKTLAAILHLGNLTFNPILIDNNDGTDVVRTENLIAAVNLLSVSLDLLLEALTKRNIFVEGHTVASYLTKTSATSHRDGFTTTLYGHVFSYILLKINKEILNHTSEKKTSIGILDIFGFENFILNSFEQLCINFSNEYLHHFFVQNVFKLEQMEYYMEGIAWKELDYIDNQGTLDLLGLKKTSILNLIDEQTKVPKGSDKGFLLKTNEIHTGNASYTPAKSDISMEFGINHYAGSVIYNVKGFVEKNNSDLSHEWLEVVRGSSNAFLKELFAKQLASCKQSSVTLTFQYKRSLESLIKTLQSCNPFFVRCLKPNHLKKPQVFDLTFCCRQLRYFGILATVKIRKAGYPVRYTYRQFVQHYHILVSSTIKKKNPARGDRDTTLIICEQYLPNRFQMGKTKVFLKQEDDNILETKKNLIYSSGATIIQKNWRRFIYHRLFKQLKTNALIIQKHWRSRLPRKRFLSIRNGIMRLQARIRSKQNTFHFNLLRRRIISFQAVCRGYLLRSFIQKRRLLNKKKDNGTNVTNTRNEQDIDALLTELFDIAINTEEDSQEDKVKMRKNDLILNNHLKNKPPVVKRGVLSFSQYAAANFTGNVGYKFSNKALEQPLLHLYSPSDCWAATAVWVTVLRFTGDIPEQSEASLRKHSSVMEELLNTLPRNYINSKEYKQAIKSLQEDEERRNAARLDSRQQKLIYLTLAHRNKLQNEVRRIQLQGFAMKKSYDDWVLTRKTTALEKVHFVIGHGILRSDLRDEIYCQLCKQLTENPQTESEVRGWVLLSLCCSCFAPSEKLTPTLLHFLLEHKNKLNSLTRLQRTLTNGTRSQPPSSLELHALKKNLDIVLNVHLMDDTLLKIQADAATTSGEICSQICDHLKITDSFGFSLYITIFGQEMSLEAGNYHVMDAICQCEQFSKERGIEETKAPWKLIFRKEMFTASQGLTKSDPIAEDLIYCQIIRGIREGYYKCLNDIELADYVAMHCYIYYGLKMFSNLVVSIIQEIIPEPILKKYNAAYWVGLAREMIEKNHYINERKVEKDVKRGVTYSAKEKWPLLFSKFYDVTQIAGNSLGPTTLLLAVNSDGVYLTKNSAEVLLKLSYIEIKECFSRKSHEGTVTQISISTIQGQTFSFQTLFAHYIGTLVRWMIADMKRCSKYVLAIDHFKPPDEGFLSLKAGDLILLDDSNPNKEWFRGRKVSSDEWGEFPSKSVVILPTLKKPPKYLLDHYLESLKNESEVEDSSKSFIDIQKYSLENYAAHHFKLGMGKTGLRTKENICVHSVSPLTGPLHALLSGTADGVQAMSMFSSVLSYMGDKPTANKARSPNFILEIPFRHENLRDEFYCQMMKQLTENPKEASEARGWQLLWLASGLFACSGLLLMEFREFLKRRSKVICQEIRTRIEILKEKKARKCLCHWAEIDSVQHGDPLSLTVSLPNSVEKVFPVDSLLTVKDFLNDIQDWIGIQNEENRFGFSLAVTYQSEMVCLPNGYLFDSIQEASSLLAQYFSITNENDMKNFKLCFFKSNWTYTVPGSDERADSVCHYPQELMKYLQGVYRCTLQETTELASFILLAEGMNFESEMKQRLLTDLLSYVPNKEVTKHNNYGIKEWIVNIGTAHQKYQAISRQKAKEYFLRHLFKFSNFGASYFNLKKKKEEANILGINRNGIFIMSSCEDIIRRISLGEIQDFGINKNIFIVKLFDNKEFKWEMDCISNSLFDLLKSYLSEQ